MTDESVSDAAFRPLAGAQDIRAAPAANEAPRLGLVSVSLLAVIIGVVTGVGAVLFRDLIGLIHNIFFAGTFSWNYDANVFTGAAPWGPWVVLVPVIGGLGVTFLVVNF